MNTQKKICSVLAATALLHMVHISNIILAFTYSKSWSRDNCMVGQWWLQGCCASNVDVFVGCAEYSMQDQRLQKHSFAPRGTNNDKSLSGQSKPKNKGTAPLLLSGPTRVMSLRVNVKIILERDFLTNLLIWRLPKECKTSGLCLPRNLFSFLFSCPINEC